MESAVTLANSSLCRLCCQDNKNGIDLFMISENSDDLCSMINRYLPVKVEENEEFLPKKICPGCHIQLEATKMFMDLIIEGQSKLRDILKSQQLLLAREEKERKKLEQALHNHNPNATVETYTIQTDGNGEKYIIQIYSEGPLFSSQHQLVLKAEGLDKPKRKRGRPPKSETEVQSKKDNSASENRPAIEDGASVEPHLDSEGTEEVSGRHKRRIRPPARYDDGVKGKELVKILKKEGVIDDELEETYALKNEVSDDETIVGKVIPKDGEKSLAEKQVIMRKPRLGKFKTRRGKSKPRFTCDICKKDFLQYRRYEVHRNNHRIMFKCQQQACDVRDKNKAVVVEHQKVTGHEGVAPFEEITMLNSTIELSEVDQSPSNELELTPDVQKGPLSFHCKECAKTFCSKQSYEVHMNAIHDGDKPFQCRRCPKKFAYAISLRNHMVCHTKLTGEGEIHKCDVCEKSFLHQSSLAYHKDTEHGVFRFICNKCNKSFKHRQLLLRHQLVHSEERPFKCDSCERHFKSRTHLSTHQNIHKGNKKFICPLCGNAFLHKTSLWVHLKWHEGNKPHVCAVCKKGFAQKGNLIEHQRIHTGEKPFQCNVCGDKFKTSSQCKIHMKRHTGEKPYSCKFCKKRFLHKDTYQIHLRRHLDQKPYNCRFCTRTFTDSWNCTRHERIHLGIKNYKCQICDRSFTDAANFNKHKKIHLKTEAKHPEKEPVNRPVDNQSESKVCDINLEFLPEDTSAIVPQNIQIHDLLDNEGNRISVTTADGQTIPIVASATDQLQGLLPDGTLVSFDIMPTEDQGGDEAEISTQMTVSDDGEVLGETPLSTNIQFLDENSVSTGMEVEQQQQAFLSADGKVCFITAFDENAFLAMT